MRWCVSLLFWELYCFVLFGWDGRVICGWFVWVDFFLLCWVWIRVDVGSYVVVVKFCVKICDFFLLIVDVGSGDCYCFYDVWFNCVFLVYW